MFVAVSLLATWGQAATLYIAPEGNDAWSGASPRVNRQRNDGPLASLVGARDAIRRLREKGMDEAFTVEVRGGAYLMEEPFVLEPRDSGTHEHRIIYRAYRKEKPRFQGGKRIQGWRKTAPGRWVAELPDVRMGAPAPTQFFLGGERKTRARTPNKGFYQIADRVDPDMNKPENNRAFHFQGDDIKDWNDPEVNVVVIHSWETSRLRIASVNAGEKTVNFTGPARWPFTQWDPKQRYFVENLPEALDEAGEWYANGKTGEFTYLAAKGERPDRTEAVAPRLKQFVLFQGVPEKNEFVTNITLSGLTFEYAAWELPPEGISDSQAANSISGVIEMRGARLCAIENCEIAHIGTYGIRIRTGSRDNRFERNHLRDLGAGGICIGETGIHREPNLDVAHNLVFNNYIHDGGHVYEAAVGVWIGQSSDNTISNNEISDLGYTGVSVGWTWGYGDSAAQRNLVEYNHIHHIGTGSLSDMGGIYTLGESAGSALRYNHIHHVTSYHYGGWGIYPDEGTSHMLIENNVVHDTRTGGFHQHYGKENLVRNNIFARSQTDQIMRSRIEEHRSFRFERNLVYYVTGDLLGTTWKDDHFFMDYNLYWRTDGKVDFKGQSLDEWRAAKNMDWNSLVADPLFRNAAKNDFRLSRRSPARGLGFQEIDLSRTGLQGPRAWRDLPNRYPAHRQVWPESPKSKSP